MLNKNFRLSLVFLLLSTVFLGFFINIVLVRAHIDKASHTEYLSYPYFQFIETNEDIINGTQIDIPLPLSNWNLTRFEANFSDIFLNEELVSIEDNPTGLYVMSKMYNSKLAVQINITEPTIIYSVEIYGSRNSFTAPVYIQINGYDIATQKPNNTILYEPVELNISSDDGWYTQTFTNPSTLNQGYYSLIIDGSELEKIPQASYSWFNNIVNASNPDLMIWTNDGSSWSTGIENQTFLHKFNQKTAEVINPEDLDMQLELNGDVYPINNGTTPGTGHITISNINFSPLDEILNIPIRVNKMVDVIFNCSYQITLKNQYMTSGSVFIEYNNDNTWNFSFTINKVLSNNSIVFYYPSNWQNISIFQNDANINSLASFNYIEHSIFITDDTLIDGAEIKIEANTLKYDFDLDIRSREFNLGQELKFSIDSPSPGNYSVILYDSLGYSLDNSIQMISIPDDPNLYTYYIPDSAKEGEYHAFVYFFDGFNAGIEVASFNIQIPLIITLSIILISSAVGISSIASSYVIIKKHKKKKEARKKAIYDKFNDILNLTHVMISERKSSLNVYEQTFTAKTVDTNLITGFLSAIRTFGIELTNVEDTTQTIKLEYKNSKILMSEFQDFRIVLIMNDTPSARFLESLDKLSHDIELRYGKLLENFKGNLQPFTGIEDLLKHHLNTSFLYPLKIVKTGKVKINQLEKNVIVQARNIMKKRNSSYFYISYLIEEKSLDPKDIEVLFSLLEKKVFQPVI
jgi:hypothetical protein